MTNILLVGACGKMGRVIADCISKRDNCSVVAGVDPTCERYSDFPIYKSCFDVKEKVAEQFKEDTIVKGSEKRKDDKNGSESIGE